jgi:hypothetical protein
MHKEQKFLKDSKYKFKDTNSVEEVMRQRTAKTRKDKEGMREDDIAYAKFE